MKHIKLIISAIIASLILASCQSNEQNLEHLDKKSAREVTLTTVVNGDSVYHITKQNIWFNGEKITEKADTITTPLKMNTWSAADSSSKLNTLPIYVTVQ